MLIMFMLNMYLHEYLIYSFDISFLVGLKKTGTQILTTAFGCRFEKKIKNKKKINESKKQKYAVQQLVTNTLAIQMNPVISDVSPFSESI